MKVVTINRATRRLDEVGMANPFQLGSAAYMVVRNPYRNQAGEISVVNLQSGEVSVLDSRTMVIPLNLEVVELE